MYHFAMNKDKTFLEVKKLLIDTVDRLGQQELESLLILLSIANAFLGTKIIRNGIEKL